MINQVIFLVALLILISLAPESMSFWVYSPGAAFAYSLLIFGAVMGLVWLQRHLKSETIAWRCVNSELLLCLSVYYFLLGGQRVFSSSPTASALFSLLLYFVGIAVFYGSRHKYHTGMQTVRLLLPVALPFILLTACIEVFEYLFAPMLSAQGTQVWGQYYQFFAWGGVVVFFCLLLSVMPLFMIRVWACRPMPEGPLRARLEKLCHKASFRYADLKLWTVLEHSLTAAIVGVIPRCRYVLFSKRLLDELPPEDIEAILAHEIGHQYRRHLLLYPLIFLGFSLAITALAAFWGSVVAPAVDALDMRYPSPFWEPAEYFALFLACALSFALYFRYIFGFFSRLCERQADLHVFQLFIDANHLIHALDAVAIGTGHSHTVPNWHHYSIKERMDFLSAAKQDYHLVVNHHRYVRLCVAGFVFLMLIGFALEVMWL